MSALEEEISSHRRNIVTDAYPMSVGEFTNLYRDGEVDVHPEFQRIFRWDATQRTRLIESILLGIPLPSIFVAQSEDGIWDVVDGVQRISTILQFQGVLRDDEGELVKPDPLLGTEFLPSLESVVWESDDTSVPALTRAQRLDFKRFKLNLNIVKRESSSQSKYDLFQRLNSYGSQATPQEVRSCVLIGSNRDFYYWVKELASNANFLSTVALSGRLLKEQYHLELALRFLVFRKMPATEISTIGNLGEYLTTAALDMALDSSFDYEAEESAFVNTFRILDEAGGDQVFKRWSEGNNRFQGAFLNTAFEIVAMGLGYHIDAPPDFSEKSVLDRAKAFWSTETYSTGFATGVRADTRMARSIPVGRELFAK